MYRLLFRYVKTAKSHCNTTGVFHKKYGQFSHNATVWKNITRNITKVTSMPFESTTNKLVKSYDRDNTAVNKVTVVGTGEAAVASTFALLAKGVTKDVCMLGIDDEKLQGEKMDMQQGSMYLSDPNIVASKDHSDSAGSKICVVAAGTEQDPNENEYDFISRNTGIVRAVVPELMKYSPEAVYLIANDPVDVLSYQAWRAGGMPRSRIMGTGTNLDSARFRYMMADRLGMDPSSCLGVVVGRNPCNPCGPCGGGRGGVPVWSTASVSGIRLMDLNPKIGTKDDPEMWLDCYEELIKNEMRIRKLKGGYIWSMALSIVDICEAILYNTHRVHTVSTYAKGEHWITDDVFISLPCVLGLNGIEDIVHQPLSASEMSMLRKDARAVTETQEVLKILQ